ncbi:OmpA family protein [Tepidicaulis sp. LMO-SS28]|uniref:OmpA family protein n=1 Tax=Tepidicaulis sp. LMO-SS28 TaxID=3447455 RepID=UPI003EE23951
MKNHVRAGGAGMRGGKAPAARRHVAASLLVLLASPALAPAALADDVSVNWEALGKPAPSNERIILRNPGEKETLPVVRLQPPGGMKDTPTPLAKPVIIPESAAKVPAPAGKPAEPEKKAPEVAEKPAEAPQIAVPEERPAKSAPKPAETVKAEPETPKAPEAAAPAPAPEPAPQTAAARPEPKPEPAPAAAPDVESNEDGTSRVTLPSAAAKTPAAAVPEKEPAAPAEETADASGEQKLAALSPPEPAFARVLFDEGSTTILSAARAELDAAASRLQQNSERVQLKAYGGDPGELSSEARKLSLRRALAVYNYLRDQGVLTSRMDVRAFGGTRDAGPTERVDIVVQER